MHTSFQQQHIAQIAAQPNFSNFVQVQDVDGVHGYNEDRGDPRKGPVLVLFYTSDNVLHAHRIGQRRLLYSCSNT
jgi:hypothetical protein